MKLTISEGTAKGFFDLMIERNDSAENHPSLNAFELIERVAGFLSSELPSVLKTQPPPEGNGLSGEGLIEKEI